MSTLPNQKRSAAADDARARPRHVCSLIFLLARRDVQRGGATRHSPKLVFERHHHLDGVERIETEIVGKVRRRRHLGRLDLLKLLDHRHDARAHVGLGQRSRGRVGAGTRMTGRTERMAVTGTREALADLATSAARRESVRKANIVLRKSKEDNCSDDKTHKTSDPQQHTQRTHA